MTKLVNAVPPPAQKIHFAFAIVKAARCKDLGIIKERGICSEINLTILKKIFSLKLFVKFIKEIIFPFI